MEKVITIPQIAINMALFNMSWSSYKILLTVTTMENMTIHHSTEVVKTWTELTDANDGIRHLCLHEVKWGEGIIDH